MSYQIKVLNMHRNCAALLQCGRETQRDLTLSFVLWIVWSSSWLDNYMKVLEIGGKSHLKISQSGNNSKSINARGTNMVSPGDFQGGWTRWSRPHVRGVFPYLKILRHICQNYPKRISKTLRGGLVSQWHTPVSVYLKYKVHRWIYKINNHDNLTWYVFIKIWNISSVVNLRILGCFSHYHYTPSPKDGPDKPSKPKSGRMTKLGIEGL